MTQETNQLPRSESIRLLSLEHEDLDLREKEENLKETAKHWLSPFVMVCRPTQIGAGLIGLLFGLLIFSSLFMTKYWFFLELIIIQNDKLFRFLFFTQSSVLRAMFSLGEEFGYLMPSTKVLNPLDRFSLFIQRVFPLDFAVLIFLGTFIVLAATSGFQKVGIGIPWIKVFSSYFVSTKL